MMNEEKGCVQVDPKEEYVFMHKHQNITNIPNRPRKPDVGMHKTHKKQPPI